MIDFFSNESLKGTKGRAGEGADGDWSERYEFPPDGTFGYFIPTQRVVARDCTRLSGPTFHNQQTRAKESGVDVELRWPARIEISDSW